MIKVPHEFTPTINTIYPHGNLIIFEDWFSYNDIPNTNRQYLPIQWTAYHVNNNYGNDIVAIKRLQDYVDLLPRNFKYFTIVQYDDGCLIDFKDLDILIFSMSKKIGVEIPLLCMPHKFEFNGEKEIYASFIGTHTHPIREHIFNIKDNNYYISDNPHNEKDFCNILASSLFGLCPRGYGLNSFRIAECMQYGTIPVYISDEFIGVFDANFEHFGVLVKEKDAHRITEILYSIPLEIVYEKQKKIKEYYDKYYTYAGAFNQIITHLQNEYSSNT